MLGGRAGSAVAMALALLVLTVSSAAALPWPHSEAGFANLATAREDARRILEALPVPPGATPSAQAPTGTPSILLRGPGRIGPPTAAHARGWWTVPGDPVAAIEWMLANPPAGLAGIGSGMAVEFGSEDRAKTAEFTWPEIPGVLTNRALYAAAVPGPADSAILRADALVTWFLSRPPEEQIPDSTRLIEVLDERPASQERRIEISKRQTVRWIAALIDGLPASAAEKTACPRNRPGHFLRLTFRAKPGGPALAEASQALPALGDCQPLDLRIGGKTQMPLGEGQKLYKALKPLLAAARGQP